MKHVVIVDDNDTQLVLLELLLNQMGIKPVSFLNPLKAYEYIKANRIDLLISDFNMPDINGIELIHEVKKLFPDLQTAIVSAIRDTDGGLKQECDYLNSPLLLKPFDMKGFKSIKGAYLKGFLLGDGTHIGDRPLLNLYDTKFVCEPALIASAKGNASA